MERITTEITVIMIFIKRLIFIMKNLEVVKKEYLLKPTKFQNR